MDQGTHTQPQDSTKSPSDSSLPFAVGSLSIRDEAAISSSEVSDILQLTARHFSRAAQSPNSSLVQKANDKEILEKVEEIVRTHFHPLNLTSLPAIIIYLLLNYFLLQREKREISSAKKLYEEHIALLKEKSSELEDRLRESRRESSRSPSSTSSMDSCHDCEETMQKLASVSREFDRLKQSYDELCHINQQWALDYEALTKQISNATGFHSVATSSSARSTPNSTSTQFAPASFDRTSTTAPCQRCSIYESQLQDQKQESEDLGARIVGLREDVKEYKERLTQKQREMSSLENEYQILRLQMQEIGDLQQTLNMKQDYRKLQYSLQHKNKLYQDAMCEKLELQKQVEKLRQAFLKFFPAPVPSTQQAPPISSSAPHTRTPQCYSFPMHSCRHNVQSHVADPNPPTPPGLIARGDLRGGLVEKDEHPLSAVRLEDHARHPTSAATATNSAPAGLSSTGTLQTLHPPMAMTVPHPSSHHHHHHSHYNASSPTRDARVAPELVLTTHNSNSATGPSSTRTSHSHSSDYESHSHSTDQQQHHHRHPAHSQTRTSMTSLVPSVFSSNVSPPPTSTSSGHTQNHHTSSLSSLGYASDERNGMESLGSLVRSTPNLVYCYPSRSSELSSSGKRARAQMQQKSLSEDANESLGSELLPRPTSLGLISRGGGAVGVPPLRGHAQVVGGQHQLLPCPNCKRILPVHEQESSESWFQHIKFCST